VDRDTHLRAELIVVALVVSFADVFFDVANFTFLPRVVPKAQCCTPATA
jgi:H+/gluconate symporter-like permease